MIIWTIYKITCLVNNKVYIGQHKTKTKNINDTYFASGLLINRALEKYGMDNFVREIIEIVDNQKTANVTEEKYIAEYDSTNRNIGYNITAHAFGGQPMTEATKLKISKASKGRKLSEEVKQRIRLKRAQLPKQQRTTEQNKKSSEMRKGMKWCYDPITLEAKQIKDIMHIPENWVFGRPKSHTFHMHTVEARSKAYKKMKDSCGFEKTPETRRKISETLKGHIISDETKSKISETLKGNIVSDETKAKISNTCKIKREKREIKNEKISNNTKDNSTT